MQTFESGHYIFHYGANTAAARDIRKIAALQEGCFSHICAVLGLTPDFRIEYFLCDSPEEVGRIYGDDDPCNGFASPPDRIYAVYNETVQCVGFHEDAHIISYMLNRPDCPAVREGLAMYFDRRWWGIGNLDWTGYYLKTGRYLPMDKLLDREFFCAHNGSFTYPIAGAFTDWLLTVYGRERYMEMYSRPNPAAVMEQVYGKTPAELNADFEKYVRLFRTDGALEARMEELLRQENAV